MRKGQLHARVHASALTPQPLAVQEVGPGEINGDMGPTEPVDLPHHEAVAGPQMTQRDILLRLDLGRAAELFVEDL